MTHPAPLAANYCTLDAGLIRLAGKGADLVNGMTSHAPMVIEALCALNRSEAVAPWLDRHLDRVLDRPSPTHRSVDLDHPETDLGQEDRFEDWAQAFARQLTQTPWPQVVNLWVDRLAPSASAAATHGLIRTAHAVRALGQATTPPRLRELADALATWACTAQTLSVGEAEGIVALRPQLAISKVKTLPEALKRATGSITGGLAQLVDWPPFAADIHRIDASGDLTRLFDDMGETFAALYLANARDDFRHIVFVHAITVTEAARGLAHHLDEGQARRLARHVWHVGCGLYVRFGTEPLAPVRGLQADDRLEALDQLRDAAVASGDDHAIKLVQACLARHHARPSPAHLMAARKALDLFALSG
jgi:hypothetical protein